jgi:hypothetical protein
MSRRQVAKPIAGGNARPRPGSAPMSTRQLEKCDRAIVAVGFAALAVVLVVEGLALYHLNYGVLHFQEPSFRWPETVMKLLFGKER